MSDLYGIRFESLTNAYTLPPPFLLIAFASCELVLYQVGNHEVFNCIVVVSVLLPDLFPELRKCAVKAAASYYYPPALCLECGGGAI